MQGELLGVPQKSSQRPFIQSPYRIVHEAAQFLRLSPQTLNNMRSKGTGPSYYKQFLCLLLCWFQRAQRCYWRSVFGKYNRWVEMRITL